MGELESMSAIQARKWKQSIKFDGKPIGEWLSVNDSALASQEDIGSPYTDKSDSLESLSQNNEHDNAGSQDTSLQQPNCINSTNAAIVRGNQSRESLEFTCTQSGSITPADSDMEEVQVNNTSITGDYAIFLQELEEKLSASLQAIVRSALSSLRTQLELELKTLRTNVEHLLGRITELESKVERVQEVLPVSSDTGRDMNVVTPSIAVIGEKNACESYADMAAQEQLKELQSQVQSLSSKQTQLELEKERERRICNVLIGNLHEGEDESEDELNEKVAAVFTDISKSSSSLLSHGGLAGSHPARAVLC